MFSSKRKKLYRVVHGQISNFSLQKFTASACKHAEYLYPVVRKTSPQSVQAKKKTKKNKRSISNRRWLNFELKLTTVHCKCSQTHRVSLPSSSRNLAAKCASKRKKLYRVVHGQISNFSLQKFTASACKHAEYLYPVVRKTSPQSVQAKKKQKKNKRSISNRQWLNFELIKLTTIHCKCSQTHRVSLPCSSQNLAAKCASKKKRTISNRPWSNFELKLTTIHCKCSQTHRVSLPSSSQNLAAKCASQKKKKLKESESTIVHPVVFLCFRLLQILVQFLD